MRSPLSIWIVPPASVRSTLRGLVGRHGQSADFTPHVTVVGDLDRDEIATIAAAREVVRRILPVTIRFGEFDTGDSFFRSVFLRVDAGAGLVRAHRAACEALDVAPDREFDPHLSLAYGEVTTTERSALEAEVEARGLLGTGFEASDLTVVHAASTVPIESWAPVETITSS